MTPDEERRLIEEDPNFVRCRRLYNSLASVEERYPDVCPDHVIASLLMIPEGEVPREYERIVAKLRELMGVKPE